MRSTSRPSGSRTLGMASIHVGKGTVVRNDKADPSQAEPQSWRSSRVSHPAAAILPTDSFCSVSLNAESAAGGRAAGAVAGAACERSGAAGVVADDLGIRNCALTPALANTAASAITMERETGMSTFGRYM